MYRPRTRLIRGMYLQNKIMKCMYKYNRKAILKLPLRSSCTFRYSSSLIHDDMIRVFLKQSVLHLGNFTSCYCVCMLSQQFSSICINCTHCRCWAKSHNGKPLWIIIHVDTERQIQNNMYNQLVHRKASRKLIYESNILVAFYVNHQQFLARGARYCSGWGN